VLSLKSNFAPSQLTVFDIPNKNRVDVSEMLDRKLRLGDKGVEVGSINYIGASSFYFMRARALQSEYYSPFFDSDTISPIRPQVFVDYNLKKGDLIISKDSNIGECIILDKDYPNFMLSGALYKLPISKRKLYLFAFLKHSYFREQLSLIVPRGSTIRHAKTLFLKCKIPLSDEIIIKYVELLVQSILNKEAIIKLKHHQIFEKITMELIKHQKSEQFVYEYPKYSTIQNNKRIDAGIYSEYLYKNNFIIRNYKLGFSDIKKLGFMVNRGQNLQVSCIGSSIYSDEYIKGFYTIIKPSHLSTYGTDFSREYLGNSRELKVLKKGDIIFGAEGFQKGRSMVVIDDKVKTITNIHGIIFHHICGDIDLSIFVKCFLDYLRNLGLIDIFAVGGNGGSLAMSYWDNISIPKFPKEKQKEVSKLYYNTINYPTDINMDNFLEKDQQWNRESGILDIDKSIKKTKEYLDVLLDKIINNKKITITFDFL
jgi:type I restriction enzyme S subunit